MPFSTRIARVAIPALAFGVLVAVLVVYFERGFVPGDAFVYLAAGERLNDGHQLYAISPGDRPIEMKPPYWTVPLLSPPPIAVLFRPLAALPHELGVYVWWAACVVAILATITALVARRPILAGAALLVLAVPVAYELGVGNVNGFVLAGLVLAWFLFSRGKETAAGATLAAIAVLKVTPAVLVVWLIAERRWRAVGAFVATGVALAAVSVLGAGFSPHLEYLGIARQTGAVGSSDLSLAGTARFLGVAPSIAALMPIGALAIGVVAIWLLRDRPGLAFSAGVVTMVAASPVVNINWLAMLMATLAPAAWAIQARHEERARSGAREALSAVDG